MQDVAAELEGSDTLNHIGQGGEHRDVLVTFGGGSFGFVFPADDVDEHCVSRQS